MLKLLVDIKLIFCSFLTFCSDHNITGEEAKMVLYLNGL